MYLKGFICLSCTHITNGFRWYCCHPSGLWAARQGRHNFISTFTIAMFKCGLDSYDLGLLRLYRLYSIEYVHGGAFTEPTKFNNSGVIVQIIAIQSGADVVLGFIITVVIFTLIERSTSPTFFPDRLQLLFLVISLIETTKFGRNVRLIFRFLMILILGPFCSGRLRGLPHSDGLLMCFFNEIFSKCICIYPCLIHASLPLYSFFVLSLSHESFASSEEPSLP